MNDGTYEGILNQDDVQEYLNGDDARPFYPERAERVTVETCHHLHAEIADLQKQVRALQESLIHETTRAQRLMRQRNIAERDVFENYNLSKYFTELFLCANAAKRQMRRERDAAHQSRNRIVWLVRRYCALNQMNLAFFLDSEKLLRDARINLDAANKRAEQAEFELVEAQSRLIAGAVCEKLDSVTYWKTRAEQAEAERDAEYDLQIRVATIGVELVTKMLEEYQAEYVKMVECFRAANAAKRQMRRERNEARAERDAEHMKYADAMTKIVALAGVEVPIGGITAPQAVEQLKAALDAANKQTAFVTNEAISLLSSAYCEAHQNEIALEGFGVFAEKEKNCPRCTRRELDAANKRAEQAEADARALAQRVFETEILTDSEIEIVARYVPREQMEGAGYK